MNPPSAEWKKVLWRDKDLMNQSGLPQHLSEEEWWYSHKNLVDVNNGNKQIGYVAVGYQSDLVYPNAGKEADMQYVFNEGSDSPFNPIPSNLNLNNGPLYAPACGEFTFSPNSKTNLRGMVSRLDLNGDMVWCRLPVIHQDGITEVIQSGAYIYVIGTHYGAKNMAFSGKSFLAYNPTSSNPSNYFSISALGSGAPNGVTHIFVAKYDLDGNIVWQALYGAADYSGGAAAAWGQVNEGKSLMMHSNGDLYAVGYTTVGSGVVPLILRINPSNGYLVLKHSVPLPSSSPTDENSNGNLPGGVVFRSITEISNGNIAIGGNVNYSDYHAPNSTDFHRGIVYSFNSSLGLNTNWSGNNPRTFQASSGIIESSSIWELSYHNTLGQLMVGVMNNCDQCAVSNNNWAQGEIWRINPSNGSLVSGSGITNPALLGTINAFDLKIGVIETSDGGFAAVSSRRNGSFTPPTNDEMGSFTLTVCGDPPYTQSYANPTGPYGGGSTSLYAIWDTDPLVVKFDQNGNKLWEWSEDITPGRARQFPPGDMKRQECMYKITETEDLGLAISGNCSFNLDDYYMVKLASDCNANQSYDYSSGYFVTTNETWNTSMNIMGRVLVQSGAVLTIDGNTTKIRFADTQKTGIKTDIWIQPGGRVILSNGAELTSIDNAVCPGSMWDGIVVEGDSHQTQVFNSSTQRNTYQGNLSVYSSTISNARCAAITAGVDNSGNFDWGASGGVIWAHHGDFVNNTDDIKFMPYPHTSLLSSAPNNNSELYECRFLQTGLLNNAKPVIGHVTIWGTDGVKLRGCEFDYSAGSAYPDRLEHGYGIFSVDAKYSVEDGYALQSKFTELRAGIEVKNSNPLKSINVEHAVFTENEIGIEISSMQSARIDQNSFSMINGGYGVHVNNCKNYAVSSNTFANGGGVGVYAINSGAGGHKIYRNSFEGLAWGIFAQRNNSGMFNYDDGLLMNCNIFSTTNNNSQDIGMIGAGGAGNYSSDAKASVAYYQGVATTGGEKLVRNQYGATCTSGNSQKKWFINNNSSIKTVIHDANSDAVTRPVPQPNCSNLLLAITSNGALDFSNHCKMTGSRGISNNDCECARCCLLADINIGISDVKDEVNSLKNEFDGVVDGGNTQALLDEITTATLSSSDLRALLLTHSPYLSDTVLVSYFTSVAPFANKRDVHLENSPVDAPVWTVIENQEFSEGDMEELITQQTSQNISARRILEGPLSSTKFELQFLYGEKLNYFLHDTLEGAKDSVITILWQNEGKLPDTKIRLVDAYVNAGDYERAFDYADSLSNISQYEEIMTLRLGLLKLDTVLNKKAYLEEDEDLFNLITEYSDDSTKAGSWLARAVLDNLYQTGMRYVFLAPDEESSSRAANNSNEEINELSELNSTTISLENGEKGFTIFPNPSKDRFTLLFEGKTNKQTQYAIHDILGRNLQSGLIIPNTPIEIDSSPFGNGIYFITLMQNGKIIEKRKQIIMK